MTDQESNETDEPLFNIGVDSRMTYIAEDIICMWERRNQFSQSARITGGNRLHSQHEIARLKWIKSCLEEGMQVSKAIRVLRQTEQVAGSLAYPIGAAIPVKAVRRAQLRFKPGIRGSCLLLKDDKLMRLFTLSISVSMICKIKNSAFKAEFLEVL